MQSSLALTALLMGLAGGPHCVAMCGAACAGISQAAGPHKNTALWTFQLGRIIGYAILGGLAAASLQGLGWLTVQSAALRPVWSLFHVAALVLGLMLLFQARQPVWLESTARRVWARTRAFAANQGRGAPMVIGMAWALLPCGLLYSALLVAALAGSTLGGAMVMALFAAGTSVTMVIGPWLWLRLNGAPARLGSGQWGVRLAGAALAVSSGWALWMALAHNAAPWCITP
ncbi:sulfite exporter TauE/SafE family protein [Candidatus Aalborgicola defluviihabitans]|jgi:sulfite exporter TauE/SafE|uniref:sulfite exporter TauE/SafE family protein n=1 Tax=Candidatus Aalborgicola defluviihabitans TaxID=3386187 RepID=UPI001D4B1B49|nr:sulfite exporter TauE/SafE family protein [Burkholderiales bacterium]MBK6567460.1 sulfite exporter TauE/SafE family protein [Burkholderiales bacterium]MBK7282497.1 sulfite exporter TauE/SafE family protein [Burkholderiales bacterium]MBK7314236.1 sulfite exporter TauE/SafE family protein [Burkholderiales bacterium]MBL0244813.1 sulfite exporter TauE/SafE family protein [Rhodoferax sp.]